MIQRVILGKTGMEITRIGFGGIPIQRVPEKQAVETVIHAVERGVDFLDTARAYTTSETRIGIALRETDKRVVIASKSQKRKSGDMRRDIEKSLKEIGREYLDLYQCHFVKDLDAYREITSKDGALEGLVRAREEGLIGHIGITSHSLEVLDHAIAEGLFETIMVCYSYLEPLAQNEVIPRALENDMGVIIMKSFSGGVIDNARLAMKYGLALEGTVLIPGVENIEKFEENWKVFLGDHTISDEEITEIEENRNLFDKQFCRRCDYCQPCPDGISIQTVLGIRSMVKRMGAGILEKGWTKDALEKARDCTGCLQCVERCPYDLPIPELIKENLAWVEDEHG